MEIIAKSAAGAIAASLVCLLIRKHNPELSAGLNILVTVVILTASSTLFETIKELALSAVDMLGASTTLIRPMLKCAGIAFISKFSADVCRDASNSAAASALELTGTLCSASVAMPTLISLLKMIGTLI